MTHTDPFDGVLHKLDLYQRIQGMNPIPTAAIPAAQNNALEVLCCTRWNFLVDIKSDVPSRGPTDPLGLVLQFIKFIHPVPQTSTRIRPISLILNLDGTVQAEPVHRMFADKPPGVYSARYRIPMSTIRDLPLEEQVWRAEKFALGTLLYELLVGHEIFERLSDDEVQRRYCEAATFPDLEDLPIHFQCLIYACWSAEFGRYIALGKFRQYIDDNPARFALQVTGAVISTAAIITVPVLGAVGFSAIGPVAGSVAAGWQAAIGAVEAGSLFALCQSAAMGGAVVTGLAGTGAGAAAVALGASGLPSVSGLRNIFIRKFRASVD
ncbi:hypothetical protein PILCRDRAFT_823696 [Piloderma croceum F 1598]|uniref:Protein kinase domain-containing protein n=1 Tax=Piloderma croceum (strain F 1598) TaxID=765440 RepID=A0A0C3FH48_PILCF|nr:hypothetical protein PILCRDRAFT_823696 [Piloderma croceum F 1598]